jgi:hypothetical protein
MRAKHKENKRAWRADNTRYFVSCASKLPLGSLDITHHSSNHHKPAKTHPPALPTQNLRHGKWHLRFNLKMLSANPDGISLNVRIRCGRQAFANHHNLQLLP